MIDKNIFPELKKYLEDYETRSRVCNILKTYLHFEPDCDMQFYAQAFVDVLQHIEPILPGDYHPVDRGNIFMELEKLKDYNIPLDMAIGVSKAICELEIDMYDWFDVKGFMESSVRTYHTWTSYDSSTNFTDFGVNLNEMTVKDMFQCNYVGEYTPKELREHAYHMTYLAYMMLNPHRDYGDCVGDLIVQDIIIDGGKATPGTFHLLSRALCAVTATNPEYHQNRRNVMDNIHDPSEDEEVVQRFWQKVFNYMNNHGVGFLDKTITPNKLEIICYDGGYLTVTHEKGKVAIEW